MSATEDDTELRDILTQTLENNGLLNKLKAEMRAAVFLAMDEQDKVENKTPLVNENLKKCLNTQDGRLVASLIIDFLQVFHLDFTLAVFKPEINSLNGLDNREHMSHELGVTDTDMNRNTPLLLELLKRGRHREKNVIFSEELSPRQIADARKKFDSYDKITQDSSDVVHNPNRFAEEKSPSPASKIPRFKGHKHSAQEEKSDAKGEEVSHSGTSLNFVSLKGKGQGHVMSRHSEASRENDNATVASLKKGLEVEEEADEGDSFFDDPLPKPQKTYGCSVPLTNSGASLSDKSNRQKRFVHSLREESLSGRSFSPMRRGTSLNDLSALGSDTEVDGDQLFSDYDNKLSFSENRRAGDLGRGAGSSTLASLLVPATERSAAGGGSHPGEAHHRDLSGSRNGTSNSKDKGFNDFKTMKYTNGSSIKDGVDYDDDFNSHRSDISNSEVSIGEEIEEVSVEGPDKSDKFDDITQDLSVSQLSQTQGADYIEEVA